MSRSLTLLSMLLVAGALHAQAASRPKAEPGQVQHVQPTVPAVPVVAPQAHPVAPTNAAAIIGKPRPAANGAPACFHGNGQQAVSEAQRCHPPRSAQQ